MNRADDLFKRTDEGIFCKRASYPDDPLREEIEDITMRGIKFLPCLDMKAISFALYELAKHHKLDQIIAVVRDVEKASEKHQFRMGTISQGVL